MFIEALGWVAAVSAGLLALPQVVLLMRSGRSAGVPVISWQSSMSVGFAWTAHGVLTGHANIWAPNVAFFLLSTAVLVQIGRERGIAWPALYLPGIGYGLLGIAVDAFVGPIAFAVVALVPAVLAQLAQLRALAVAVNIQGVSLGFLAFNVANQGLWLSWAVLAGEQSITLAAGSMGALMSVSLVVAMLRRAGLVRARLAAIWA